MQLSTLATRCGVLYQGIDVAFDKVSIDTRTLRAGEVYFAIIGHSLNGHAFVTQAKAAGASAIVASEPVSVDLPVLYVSDTTQALGQYAVARREQFAGKVIAVTGSVGKTTTRNLLKQICQTASSPQSVLSPIKNLNNQWGVPLTLNTLDGQHEYAVLELGMNRLGEIAYLTNIARPDVAVITCANECHLEGLGSLDNIAKAKGEIFQGLSGDGIAVLNADDPYCEYWLTLLSGHRFLLFGQSDHAQIRGRVISNNTFEVITPNGTFSVTLQLLGAHCLMNVLAATAASLALNFPLSIIQKGLADTPPEPGRMQLYQLSNGMQVIDDSYNAAPIAVRAAMKTLGGFSGKRMMVLGDMAELGDQAPGLHQALSETLNANQIDVLLTYGEYSALAHQGFNGQAWHFTDQQALIATLESLLTKDTVVLVKGSACMKMHQIVTYLLSRFGVYRS